MTRTAIDAAPATDGAPEVVLTEFIVLLADLLAEIEVALEVEGLLAARGPPTERSEIAG